MCTLFTLIKDQIDLFLERTLSKLRKEKRQWENEDRNPFTLRGYEIVENFLETDECNRLIQLAEKYRSENNYIIEGNTYYLHRKNLRNPNYKQYDFNTMQIFNLHEIDTNLARIFASGKIEELFRNRLKRPVSLASCTLQIDDVDTKTRQPLHVDSYEATFKCFIYLNDVTCLEDGPYTIVSGSHKHLWKKFFSYVINKCFKISPGQMHHMYTESSATAILGKKGTLFISTQNSVHGGYRKHTRNTRYVLVFYLVEGSNYRGPFTHGMNHIIDR